MTLPSPQPKVMPYLTIIPSRRPEQKLHANIGHAKNAITGKFWYNGAESDMQLLEYVDGEWKVLYEVKQGDRVAPWQVEKLKKQAEKKEKAEREFAQKQNAEAIRVAKANARRYYENVIGEPRPGDEDYDNFVEGYIEGFLHGRRWNNG